jgi:hypothetical protein
VVSAPTPPTADANARLGLSLAIVGVGLLPITLLAVGLSPQGARAAVFLMGLSATATVSIWGGVRARRALLDGTTHTVRAMAGGILGLVVGVTAAFVALWSLIGLVA